MATDLTSEFDELNETGGYGADGVARTDDTIPTDQQIPTADDLGEETDPPEPKPKDEAEDRTLEDEIRERAEVFGVDPDAAMRAGFSSVDEFDRAIQWQDRQLLASPPAGGQHAPTEPPATAGQQTVAPPAAQPGQQAAAPTFGRVDVEKLKEEGVEDYVITLGETVNTMADMLENAARQQAESSVAESRSDTQRKFLEFHDVLSELNPARYGKARDESGNFVARLGTEHDNHRRRVFHTFQDLVRGAASRGQPVDNVRALLARADAQEFAKENRERERKARTAAAARAGRSTTGTGSRRRSKTTAADHDSKVPLENAPYLHERLDEMMQENE